MPADGGYPGVYVEEAPGGPRTIDGVPTSICAFVGRAARGPIDTPVVVTSFAEFERQEPFTDRLDRMVELTSRLLLRASV